MKRDPVVLTMHAEVTYATEALEAGALADVLERTSADELARAVRFTSTACTG